MQIALDWLSWSIRAPKMCDTSVGELMLILVDLMHLDSFWKKAVRVGGAKFYPDIFRIDDITFKLCRDNENSVHKQGIMIEFTSNGLSVYQKYLSLIGVTIFDVMRDLRALCASGFKVNVPRIDIAMDDICKADEKPLLKLDRIYEKWANHEFCSRARAIDRDQNLDFKTCDDGFFVNGKVCDHKKKDMIGRTIYFGSRRSAVCVRFYDKAIEQKQKGREVPDDVKHWVRCEYEFHRERACAIVSMLIDNSWDDFIQEFSRSVLGHLRFIKRDDTNRSRCSTCSWWIKFLNNVCHCKQFVIPPKKPVQANTTVRWLHKSVLPTLYAYIATIGAEVFFDEVINEGKDKMGFKQIQLLSDYVNSTPDDDLDPALYSAIFWGCLSARELPEAIAEINRDYNRLNIYKRYRSLLDDDTDKIVKNALRLYDRGAVC